MANNVKTSPVSTSVRTRSRCKEVFSEIVVSEISDIIGLSFIGSTVNKNDVVSDNSPSETNTVISVCPCQLSSGVIVRLKSSEFASMDTASVSEIALRFRVVPVSISDTTNEKIP